MTHRIPRPYALAAALTLLATGGAAGSPPPAQDPVPSATETPATDLTLAAAFRQALAANPTVAAVAAGVDAADAQRRALLATVLPRLGFAGRVTRNSEEAAFGEGDDRRIILPRDDWSGRLTLSQPLYAGNRERRAYEQAKIAVDTAQLDLDAATQGLLLQVATDYLGVVEGDALLAVERQGVELARAALTQAESFHAAGEVTILEVRRAEASLKAAERRLAGAHQQRETAAGRLRLDLSLDVVDHETPLRVAVEDEVFTAPLAPEPQLVADALAHRPEVLAARNQLVTAQLEVRKQRGAYLPVLTFDASYLEQKSPFPSDAYGSAAINLTVPLWTSGETASRVRAAVARETQARLALEASEQRVREEVRRALLDLATAETTLALAHEQQAAAVAEYEQTFALYQAQEVTALDVRAAESSRAEAVRAVVSGGLSRDLARARVWYASGQLATVVLGTPAPVNAP